MRTAALAFFALAMTGFAVAPAGGQPATGVPGSPSATTTIDGQQLPPPPPTFGGSVGTASTC